MDTDAIIENILRGMFVLLMVGVLSLCVQYALVTVVVLGMLALCYVLGRIADMIEDRYL